MQPHGDVVARHYRTRQPLRLRWSHGLWQSVEPGAIPPAEDLLWCAPPLFDPQVNGFAGVDFQQDHLPPEALLAAARSLRDHGCGRFLLTLITDEWPRLTGRLARLAQLRRSHPDLLHRIAGWHIEGPFLSAEPGYRGAHNAACMIDPSPDHIRQLRECVGPDPLLITLAPERPGALEAIAAAVAAGIQVSLGHTNASSSRLESARTAGATLFTHLGNACPQQLDRHDNILWRVLDDPGFSVSLIPDGHHVSPPLFRIIHRLLAQDRILYTTDAMAAAGAPPGRYLIGRLTLEVGADRMVRQPGQTNFAGSALTPIEGLRQAARMLNRPWQDLWDSFSTRPLSRFGLPPDFQPGSPADFCLLRTGSTPADVILVQ